MTTPTPLAAPLSAEEALPPVHRLAVIMNDMPGDAAALGSAGTFARAYGGTLNLLQVIALPTQYIRPWTVSAQQSVKQMIEDVRESAKVRAESMRIRLETMGVAGDVYPIEVPVAEPADVAAIWARRCSLSVIARPYREPGDTSVVHAYFQALLFQSTRPVMLVPSDRPVSVMPSRALIAWTDTRESTRAVRDAIPILKRCTAVDLLIVDREATLLESYEHAGTWIKDYLANQGISVELIDAVSSGRRTSAVILEEAVKRGADLIVAGGYGHNRFREWALGGTTRELFLSSTIPVMFSH